MFDIADVAYLPLLKDITLIRYQLHRFSDRHTFYQCIGSRIPDLGSRISDLGFRIQKQLQKRRAKKIVVAPFFWSHKFHKIENYYF
jgi:hypothetical protein